MQAKCAGRIDRRISLDARKSGHPWKPGKAGINRPPAVIHGLSRSLDAVAPMTSSTDTRSKIGGWPLAAAITVVLVFLFFIREILLPFILAAALAFVLTPAIDYAQQRLRLPRWLVATIGYFLVLAVFGLLGYWVGGVVVRDVADIVRRFPQLVHKLVGDLANTAGETLGLSVDANALANDIVAETGAFFGANAAMKAAGIGVTAVVGTILAMVVLIYFLISGKRIAAGVFWLVPPEYRREVDTVTAKILPMLWRYLVGLLTVVGYTFAMDLISFWLVFRIPHAVLLAIVVGLLEMIPVIGPALSIGLIVVSAIQQSSLLVMVGLIIFAVALRISIDQLVGPLVLGRAAKVHPVVIIFSFLSGAVLFGAIGLLLAVPVAASIKIVLTIYYSEPIKGEENPAIEPIKATPFASNREKDAV
jgi:predicted PurR-regulated permease PerM